MLKSKIILVLFFVFFHFLVFSQKSLPQPFQETSRILKPSILSLSTVVQGEKIYLGSGFVANKSGVIVTSYSIAAGAENISVEFRGGLTYPVSSVVYYNEKRDLLLLKIDALGLASVDFVDSTPKAGDRAYYLVSELGKNYEFASGVISEIKEEQDAVWLQFTGPVASASRGSPLVNSAGKVLGMVTTIATQCQSFNFALSSENIDSYINKQPEMTFAEFREQKNRKSNYFRIGVEAYSNQQYQKAIDFLEDFIALEPGNIDAYEILGSSLLKVRNYKKAIDVYNKILELDSESISAYSNLAFIYSARGQRQEAIDAYKEVLSLDPDSLQAWYNLSQIYIDLKKYQEAIACYQRILELGFDSTSAYSDLGWLNAAAGNYLKAISYFKKYAEINPNDPEIYFKLGLVYFEAKEKTAAKRNFLKARDLAKEYGRIELLENIEKALAATEK